SEQKRKFIFVSVRLIVKADAFPQLKGGSREKTVYLFSLLFISLMLDYVTRGMVLCLVGLMI
ncbi:MAG: hypothetical protein LBL58_13610, partial [Tannerellaceae bacterium]|nr:hypothetical protein [Tannerellaceae bacterium]